MRLNYLLSRSGVMFRVETLILSKIGEVIWKEMRMN